MARTNRMSIKIFIAWLFTCAAFSHAENKNMEKYPLILVSMDGVGWQFLDNDITDTPNFDFVARTGVKAKNMITVNPTSTFPVHMTYLTGLYPESHGIVGNKFYDPVYDETFYLENDCTNFDPKFYNDSEPIWLTMQKRGKRTGAYFWPSSTSYEVRPTFYADHICKVNCTDFPGKKLVELRKKIGRHHCKFDWFNDPYWHRIETVVKWLKSDNPPELVLLYFEDADYKGHRFGPKNRLYWQSLETADRYAVGDLIRSLKEADLLDKVNLVFISDHSMIETSNKKQIDLYDFVDSSSYHGPGFWVQPDKLEELYNNLTSVNNSHMKVYKKEDVPEKYHSKHNRRYPPLFLDVEVGWTTRTSWYNATKEGDWVSGSHGWTPNEELGAIFYARGPSFKVGYNSTKTLQAVDIYPLLCHLLDIEPLPNNGTLENMKEFLRKPRHNHADIVTINVTLLVAVLMTKVMMP